MTMCRGQRRWQWRTVREGKGGGGRGQCCSSCSDPLRNPRLIETLRQTQTTRSERGGGEYQEYSEEEDEEEGDGEGQCEGCGRVLLRVCQVYDSDEEGGRTKGSRLNPQSTPGAGGAGMMTPPPPQGMH